MKSGRFSAATRHICNERFQQTQHIIQACAKRWSALVSDDDALLSEATSIFLLCFQRYPDKELSQFRRLLARVLCRRLKRFASREISRTYLKTYHPWIIPEPEPPPEPFSDDAQCIITLCLRGRPRELTHIIRERGGNPHNYHRAVREWLLARGWTRYRYNQAVEEIQEHLHA